MTIPGQARGSANVGETEVIEWQKASLLRASVVKPILTTVEKKLVINKLRRLEAADRTSLESTLRVIFG